MSMRPFFSRTYVSTRYVIPGVYFNFNPPPHSLCLREEKKNTAEKKTKIQETESLEAPALPLINQGGMALQLLNYSHSSPLSVVRPVGFGLWDHAATGVCCLLLQCAVKFTAAYNSAPNWYVRAPTRRLGRAGCISSPCSSHCFYTAVVFYREHGIIDFFFFENMALLMFFIENMALLMFIIEDMALLMFFIENMALLMFFIENMALSTYSPVCTYYTGECSQLRFLTCSLVLRL